jgi:hypothetical protein
MLFLAAAGAAVELAAGSLRFALVFFVGGFAGVFVHWLIYRRVPEPPILLGSSAAVAACVGYYSVRYMNFRVPVAPHKGVSIGMMIGLWAVLQGVGAFWRLGDGDAPVAYWAHLGGLAMGLLLSAVFQAPRMVDLELSHEVLREMNQRSAGAALAAAEEHLQRHPEDLKGLQEKAEAHAKLGDCDEEAAAILMMLDKTPESQQPELLMRLAEINCLERLPSLRRTLLAERFRRTEPVLSARLLQSVVRGDESDPQRPDALLALAGLELESTPELAKRHLEELLDKYPLHPAAELARSRGWA